MNPAGSSGRASESDQVSPDAGAAPVLSLVNLKERVFLSGSWGFGLSKLDFPLEMS